jgi:hypothetical protein
MKTRVALRLKTLTCIEESEHGSEPYFWPIMITQETGAPRLHVPTQEWEGKVLANEMKAGQTIPIPAGMDLNLVEVFDSKSTGLVVFLMVLFEKDQLPREGSLAALHHVEEKALELVTQKLTECRAMSGERVELTNELMDRLDLKGAVTDALSYYELAKVYSRPGGFDDALGFILWTLSGQALTPGDITFNLRQIGERFLLKATLDVTVTLPPVCQAERDAAAHALAVVKGLQGQRAALQNELHHATPQQKPTIVAAITRINDVDLPPAEAALAQADAALKACLDAHGDIGGSVGPSVVGPTA